MSEKPYTVKMFCPVIDAEEEVHFYERSIGGKWYLEFFGCDHNWHKGDAPCEACHKAAYQKIIEKK